MRRLLKLEHNWSEYPCILFVLFFIINTVMSLFMKYPIITDEYNTLSEGVVILGNQTIGNTFKSLYSTGYYGWGYTILYGFVYHIFHSMIAVYHAALIGNSVLVSLIPVFAYNIAIKHFELSNKNAFLISLCLCVYPAYVIYSKYAMNETVLLFIIWPLLYMILEFQKASIRKKRVLSLTLGALSTYAYAIHGRGIAIFCVVFVLFSLLVIKSKNTLHDKLISLSLFIFVSLIVYAVNSSVKAYIAVNFAGTDIDNLKNTAENLFSKSFFKSLFSRDAIRIIMAFLAQSFYIVVTTLGLGVVAVVVYIKILITNWKDKNVDNFTLIGTFTIGLMTATLVISVLFFSNLYITQAMPRGEYYIYGRYNELTGGMLVYFVLLYSTLLIKQNEIRYAIILYMMIICAGVWVAIKVILTSFNPRLSYTMVIGMIPFAGRAMYLDPTRWCYIKVAIIISLIFLIILILLHYRKTNILCLLLVSVFTYSSIYSLKEFVYPQSNNNYEEVSSLEKFENILKIGLADDLKKVYVLDSTVPKPKIMFAISDYPVEHLENVVASYKNFEDMAEGSLFISIKDENLDHIFDEIYYIENETGYYIWGYGEDMQQKLTEIGYVCKKRDISIFVGDKNNVNILNLDTTSRLVDNNSDTIYLTKGMLQYGPYCKLKKGKYKVDVYGRNLQMGSYRAHHNAGLSAFDLSGVKKSEAHVEYYVDINELTDNAEFICENTTEIPIMIECLTITPIETQSELSINNASKKNVRYRSYDIGDAVRNFREYISNNENAIVSWRYVRMNPLGEIHIDNIPMAEGQNRLTLSGTNIAYSNMDIVTKDGEVLNFERQSLGDPDSIMVDVNASECITITLSNTTDVFIDFSTLEIRWLEAQ